MHGNIRIGVLKIKQWNVAYACAYGFYYMKEFLNYNWRNQDKG